MIAGLSAGEGKEGGEGGELYSGDVHLQRDRLGSTSMDKLH